MDDSGLSNSETAALIIVPWFLISMYWAAVCGFVATEKGRNPGGWTAAGFLGWFFAFLPLAAAPAFHDAEVAKSARTERDKARDD